MPARFTVADCERCGWMPTALCTSLLALSLLLFGSWGIASGPYLVEMTPLERSQVNLIKLQHEAKRLRQNALYLETYDQCRPTGEEGKEGEEQVRKSRLGYHFDIALSSSRQVFNIATLINIEEAVNLIRSKGLSPELKRKFESTAFHTALEDCYSGDSYQQTRFVSKLIAADVGGKAIGALAALGSWILTAGLFQKIASRGTGFWQVLRYVGYFFGLKEVVKAIAKVRHLWGPEVPEGPPSPGVVELKSQLAGAAVLPLQTIERLDIRIQAIDLEMASERDQDKKEKLKARLERLKIAKIVQVVALQEIGEIEHR